MKKKQIWLRPDQVELVSSVLLNFKHSIESDTIGTKSQTAVAQKFTASQVDECARLVSGVKP